MTGVDDFNDLTYKMTSLACHVTDFPLNVVVAAIVVVVAAVSSQNDGADVVMKLTSLNGYSTRLGYLKKPKIRGKKNEKRILKGLWDNSVHIHAYIHIHKNTPRQRKNTYTYTSLTLSMMRGY